MKKVLITGGSSGIGLELAKQFAADGYGIILTASNVDRLMAAKKTIEDNYHVPVTTYVYDLAGQGEAAKLYEAVMADGHVIDVLVNNAGIGTIGATEQIPMEKLAALMSFLSERYSNKGYGSIHSWIIGNEVNNNNPAHFQGNISVDEFAADYAKQFRVCYNAIKSHNKDARVFTNIDQRWTWVDSASPLQYPARTFLDKFASNISSTGNIDWGLSFHPHAVPMDNCRFWAIPAPFSGMGLVKSSDDSKFATIQNMEVFVNHMKQPALLSPTGNVRHIMITELGFNATSPYGSNEQIQAAALVYAYKKAMSFPEIDAFIIHKHSDSAEEAASTSSYGLRVGDYKRFAYDVFKYMDTGNTAYTDFALPIIGVSSWSQLGIQ